MTGSIPDNLIEQIRDRVDIVAVISEYVRLKKSGENFKGLCPFHSEKTPSFTVSPKKSLFYCFGCGAGGNIYTFLMRIEGLNFVEAVKALARREGIEIPASQSSKQVSQSEELNRLNQAALNFYKELLYSKEGSYALAYLKKRGLEEETIQQFKLGYAPESWQRLRDYLLSKNYPLEKQLAVGLVICKEEGGKGTVSHYYDRFRKRIIFPIFDPQDRPVAFGARVLDDSVPKYINSPESLIYSKGKTLYGLNRAKDSIRQKAEAIVVEGYLDAIISHQYGFDNVVAILGTAFTIEQVKLLKRYAERVICIFDPDRAGVAATLRGLDLLREQDLEVKVVSLPRGTDPAEFLIQNGAAKLSELLSTAVEWLDYRLRMAAEQPDINTASGRVKILNSLLETISRINNPIERQAAIKRVADFLDIPEQIILEELKRVKVQKASPAGVNEYIAQQERGAVQAENGLLQILLNSPQLAKEIIRQVSERDFSTQAAKEIFRATVEGLNPQGIIDQLSSPAGQLASQLMLQEQETTAEQTRLIKDYIQCLKLRRLNQSKREIERMLAKSSGDAQLTREWMTLNQQVLSLKENGKI